MQGEAPAADRSGVGTLQELASQVIETEAFHAAPSLSPSGRRRWTRPQPASGDGGLSRGGLQLPVHASLFAAPPRRAGCVPGDSNLDGAAVEHAAGSDWLCLSS